MTATQAEATALGARAYGSEHVLLGLLAADDDLHGVLLARCGNAAVLATVDRFTPAIRRLERQRFSTEGGHSSVALHDRLIDACAAHDVDAAVATTTEIWTAPSRQRS